MYRKFSLAFCAICLALLSATATYAESRTWTGSNGKTIEAEFITLEGDVVRLRLANGKESRVLLSKFSKNDQEYAQSQGQRGTDDPFAEAPSGPSGDSAKFEKPVDVRFTFSLTEKGKASLRIEKNPKPREKFKGAPVKLPNAPKVDFKKSPDGIGRLTFDFAEPPPQALLGFKAGQHFDTKSQKMLLVPDMKAGQDQVVNQQGWCVFSIREIAKLPLTISFDAKVVYRGECCNLEFLLSNGLILVMQVFSTGERFEDELEVLCRMGVGPHVKRIYHTVLHMNDISLDETVESSFTISSLRKRENVKFRGGIGRNVNLPEGYEKIDKPLEVGNVVFEGQLLLP